MSESIFILLLNIAVSALFAKIGSRRKVGAVWAFVLSFLLGLIGWIIVLCSKKNGPEFTDMTKGGNQ